jgi:hypothetical protein
MLVLGASLATCFAAPAGATTLAFAGYTWEVRTGQGGPGPNRWNAANAWVDTAGAMHLRMSKINGFWQCAEVYLDQRLGFGTYEFNVTGPIDQLDKNVVLGLFDYPTADVGPDGTNEIDIEFSHWGNADNPIGNYTVWPAVAGIQPWSRAFPFTLTSNSTTQRFVWAADSIAFHMYKSIPAPAGAGFIHWTYRPASKPASHIPQQPLPVHMNLWLFQGKAPANGQSVEIVINGFHFTPQ